MSDKKTIAVVFGGQSSEHEVSRVSAQSVISNINKDKFNIVMFGITKDGRWLHYDGPVECLGTGEWQAIAEAKNAKALSGGSAALVPAVSSAKGIFKLADGGTPSIDVVFPVLHGCNGEDGTVQGLFELAGIPYIGPGVLGSAVGMDKVYSKIIFEKESLPQGKYVVCYRKQIASAIDNEIKAVESVLEYPCFVKPSNAGSSVGVGKAHNREELITFLENAARYDRKVLVEEFINGREIECAVLGNDEPIASTVGEVLPCNEFYDYNAKYLDNSSKTVIPADLPTATIAEIRDYAVRAFKALDLAGLTRVDFFVHKETGKVYINEVNTLPGFTSISMYPKLWEASGIPYSELIERLAELAIERFEDNKKEVDR